MKLFKPKKNLVQLSFFLSLGVVAYVFLVSLIIRNGERLFGAAGGFWAPVLFLLLFVFSALVTGLLVLGGPIWYYLGKDKKEAVQLLSMNVIWLFLWLLMVMTFVVIIG